MGAVTVAVGSLARNKGDELLGATTKAGVLIIYTSVDNIGASASTGRVLICVTLLVFLAVRDTSETPSCLVVFDGNVAPASSALDNTILFNVFNLVR